MKKIKILLLLLLSLTILTNCSEDYDNSWSTTKTESTESESVPTVMPRSLSVGGEATTNTLNVFAESGCAWSLTADVDWIALSVTSGVGEATISVSVKKNTTGKERSGNVIVKNEKGKEVQRVAIQQAIFNTNGSFSKDDFGNNDENWN